jgi:hypothetical protein
MSAPAGTRARNPAMSRPARGQSPDTRRPARVPAAVLALSLLIAPAAFVAGACGKDDALPAGRITRPVEVILGHLPGDAWAVVGINAARVRQVPPLAKLLEQLPGMPPEIAGTCGFEKLGGVDFAVATLVRGAPGRENLFVALQGGFTRQTVERCIANLSATTGKPINVAHEESLTVYDIRDGSGKNYVYWPTGDFVILAPQTPTSPAALSRLIGAAGVSSNETLMSYVRRVQTDAAFWMAGPLPPELQKQMAGFGAGVPALQGFTISVDGIGEGKSAHQSATGEVAVLLRLRLGQEQDGVAAARAFRAQKGDLVRAVPDPRVTAIVNKLEVTPSGEEVALRVSLTAAEVDLVFDLVAGMSGLPGALQ